MTKDGIFIKEWESANLASVILNIQATHIAKACKGKINSIGGYRWSYV